MVRIIPRLEIKGPNLVKGVHLEGLRVLGTPEVFARHYSENGADELLYMDVVASLYQRNSLLDIIARTSREIFIPLAVGGGLRSVDDIRAALRAGADKVSLNTAAIRNPELVKSAAKRFGSSTIVVSIEAKRRADGRYEAYVNCGRERTGVDVFTWAQRVAELGAGEIFLTSIDREGTGKGFDLDLVRQVASSVPIPVIAHGGAGTVDHVREVVTEAAADAVSVSGLLHYAYVKCQQTETPASVAQRAPGLPERQRQFSRILDASIPKLKAHLSVAGLEVRPVSAEG